MSWYVKCEDTTQLNHFDYWSVSECVDFDVHSV